MPTRIFSPGNSPKARPMPPDWARSLRDQCTTAEVPYFFKQWGAWRPAEAGDAFHRRKPVAFDGPSRVGHVGPAAMVRVGKKAAGRLLDGRTWDEFPRAVDRDALRTTAAVAGAP